MNNISVKALTAGLLSRRYIAIIADSAYGHSWAIYNARPFFYVCGSDTHNLSGFGEIHGLQSVPEMLKVIDALNNAGCKNYDGCHACTMSARIADFWENGQVKQHSLNNLLWSVERELTYKTTPITLGDDLYVITLGPYGYRSYFVTKLGNEARDMYGYLTGRSVREALASKNYYIDQDLTFVDTGG